MVTMSIPRHSYVTVCGPLAVGKTTITKLLADHFGWGLLLEDLDENPYMRDYYQDMHRWGFHAVMAFLVRALTLQDEISTRLARETVCQDWHFAEHYAIYGVHVFEEGIINERERKTCEELHRYLMANAATPDLIIILTAEPTTLLTRATSRQRPSERKIPLEYIENLVARYSQWMITLKTQYLVVDTTAKNFLEDQKVAERFIAQVQELMP